MKTVAEIQNPIENVRQKSQQETDAKDELQSALNKINEQSDSNN